MNTLFHFFVAAVVLLVSYFLGCINSSVMVSRFFIRDDVRLHGSGNAGLTNFYRTYGAKYALMVILGDIGKTAVAVLIGGFMFRHMIQDWTLGVLLAGVGCVVGHVFPVFFGFKGGKGILSGGVLVFFLDWRIALVAWGLFLVLWLLTRYVSLGSLAGVISVPVTIWFVFGDLRYVALGALYAALAVYCHRENLRRLIRGEENKFQWKLPHTSQNESSGEEQDIHEK
ncbi:MAG: glycerol-3-phosphate 1-O-acyltransferase PlsY [Oscillospiraceae bacterium]|nr:glycerol-3-phosphate 1-O-acyltransferase PlsY [Oscillospiraceae bacterium]